MSNITLDIECYRDYFLVMFKGTTGKRTVRGYEMFTGKDLEREAITKIMDANLTIGFNTRKYDLPILYYALAGATNEQLKAASDDIIVNGLTPWLFEAKYGITVPTTINHIDLIEVAPGVATSLKLYGGRLHSRKLQDLPIEPDASITPDQRRELYTYCINDHDTTCDLYNSLSKPIALREQMSARYKLDLMSKSDAQIAEAVIRQGVEQITGTRVKKQVISKGMVFNYTPPDWVEFDTPVMQEVLQRIINTEFRLSEKDVVVMPESLAGLAITIGNSVYRMGIGGLHSSEENVHHIADVDNLLVDRDVRAYYPATILNQGLYPQSVGQSFLNVYREIVERRVWAKLRSQEIKRRLAEIDSELGGH